MLCVLPLVLKAQTGEKNFIDQNYIEVTGKAEMEVVPDQIFIRIVLDENDTKGRVPLSQQEASMIETLSELGVDIDRDLSVVDFTSDFRTFLFNRDNVQLTKEYQLLAHDALTAAKVFIELEKLDISNIRIDRLDHSNIEQFRQEVKVKAIQAAQQKASALAGAIGQQIGRAIYIREIEIVEPMYQMAANFRMERSLVASEISEVPDIEFEKITLDSSIQVRFALE